MALHKRLRNEQFTKKVYTKDTKNGYQLILRTTFIPDLPIGLSL